MTIDKQIEEALEWVKTREGQQVVRITGEAPQAHMQTIAACLQDILSDVWYGYTGVCGCEIKTRVKEILDNGRATYLPHRY